jgi:hypothetical protein
MPLGMHSTAQRYCYRRTLLLPAAVIVCVPMPPGAARQQHISASVSVMLGLGATVNRGKELAGGGLCYAVYYCACMQVLYTRGTPQLWKATYSAGKLVSPSNAASQDLNPAGRSVVNRAEYFGDRLWVTASGTYMPLVSARRSSKKRS